MPVHLGGILAPVVTPFASDRLDLGAFAANLERYGETALAGVVVLGSNGEAALLTDAESDAVLGAARAALPAGRTFVAGTGRESTPATIAACRRAADAGADAVLVRTPSFFKARMTTEVFVRHYEAVADASPVPVLLYNVTMFTGVVLPGEAVSALARHQNVIGLKDSGSDLAIVADFIARGGDGFTVLSGSAPTLYPSLCLGAKGAVLAVAGVVPDLCAQIHALVERGAHADALALQRRLAPLAQAVGSRFGVPGLKAALDMAGYTGGDPRGPLLPASAEARAAIRAELDALGVLA
jgi:4-hydroxy-2-oxoglutarate aldolase